MSVWVLGKLILCETSEKGGDCVCTRSNEGSFTPSTFDYAARFIWTDPELQIDMSASWWVQPSIVSAEISSRSP